MVCSWCMTWWSTLPHGNGPPCLSPRNHPLATTWGSGGRRSWIRIRKTTTTCCFHAFTLSMIPWRSLRSTSRYFFSPYLAVIWEITKTSPSTLRSKNGRHRHSEPMSSRRRDGGGRRDPGYAKGRLSGPWPICCNQIIAWTARPSISGEHSMCIVKMILS